MKTNYLMLGALLPLSLLCGRDIFVSPKGSDKNSGSAKAPFATIAYAASKAKPGDTVKIAPGIYREEITLKKSGKKGAPITFTGSRSKDGKYLSIIESPGLPLDKWERASEIGPDVWKVKVAKNPLLVMMDGKTITKINNGSMGLKRWSKVPTHLTQTNFMSKLSRGDGCKRLPGMDFFVLPKNATVSHIYFGNVKQDFWPVIAYVLCGWKNGYLYLRFVNGDTPQNHRFTASYGNGFTLENVSYINFSDLFLRGSRTQFQLSGKTSHVQIENCLMMHGGYRVRIEPTASFITVRNNLMTSGFIKGDHFKHRDSSDQRGGLIYTIFKYLIGNSRSDDVGVFCQGADSLIENNVIFQGLIGVDAFAPRITVRNNLIRGMASVGLCTGSNTTGHFYDNLIMECGIPLRIHDLRHSRAKREEYHYRNVFIQGANGGGFIYVHSESFKTKADGMNFDGKVYKKNPPNPVDPGKIYIYHNTFWGGGNRHASFTVKYLSQRFRCVMPFYFLNNVVKDCPRYDSKTHEVMAGNLLYRTVAPSAEKRSDQDVIKNNRALSLKESNRIWKAGRVSGMPQMALSADSSAVECGVDISKPYTYKGKKYEPLPGFKAGFFKGKAPYAGALQKGAQDDHFRKLYDRGTRAVEMMKKMNFK